MNKEFANTKEIDKYLSGDLTPEKKVEFEHRVEKETTLREDVELTKRVIAGIQGYGFKQMLKKIHNEEFGAPEAQ